MKKDSLLTRQLDEYRLISLLGKGGMARVYLGLDVRLRRYVAIKVIDTPHQGTIEYIHRFEREAQAVAQLEHPNVVRLYRYGEAAGLLYMAMQYIEGADLGTVLATYSRDSELMPQSDAIAIIKDICLALDYAHHRGVIHRDIKPSNIMLDKDGRAILTDFGLALLAEAGTQGEIFGTPQYTAPEQVMSSAMVVSQSDLYSLAVIIYEMFTGRLPFEDDDPLDLAVQHVNLPPPEPRQFNPTINPETAQVILKALSKRPEDRYQTGAELAAALGQALDLQHPALSPIVIPPTTSRFTIPERVTTEYDKQPLPPLPADGVAPREPAPAEPLPVALPPPTTVALLDRPADRPQPLSFPRSPDRPRSQRAFELTPLSAVLGCAGILLVLGILFTAGLFISRGLTNDATGDDNNLTPVADSSGTDQPSAATPTPAVTNPVEYNLRLLKNGDSTLFLVNVGDQPFPLAPLRLGDSSGAINGADWATDLLQRGSCVIAWEDSSDSTLSDVTCVEVGSRINRDSGERFWQEDFTVYYSEQAIGVCPKAFPECLISVTVSPAP